MDQPKPLNPEWVSEDGCCDAGCGVRFDAHPDGWQEILPKLQPGYVIVERCDMCSVYADDLAAAAAWGDDAQWFETGISMPAIVAIAKPKKTVAG